MPENVPDSYGKMIACGQILPGCVLSPGRLRTVVEFNGFGQIRTLPGLVSGHLRSFMQNSPKIQLGATSGQFRTVSDAFGRSASTCRRFRFPFHPDTCGHLRPGTEMSSSVFGGDVITVIGHLRTHTAPNQQPIDRLLAPR